MDTKPEMHLGKQFLGPEESVEDNEEILNDSVSGNLGITSESKVQCNRSSVVENNELRQSETEKTRHADSPIFTSVKKGHGLRKWRRIKRDPNRLRDSSTDTNRLTVLVLLSSWSNKKQKSEGSDFIAGTYSENSKDQSSKSSSIASTAQTMKNEIPMFNRRPKDYDEEDCDGVIGCKQVNDGHGCGYKDLSSVAGSSSKVKRKRNENRCSVLKHDPFVESIFFSLQSVQEALEKEVLMLKKIVTSADVGDSVTELHGEVLDEEQNHHQSEAKEKAALFKKDADERLKLEKRVGKYGSCFLLQLVLFVATLVILASPFSPSCKEIIPT